MNAADSSSGAPTVPGIVVTFFPDAGFAGRLAAITREAAPVIVVDNSVDERARSGLREICAAHHARLIENSENRGLGAALNQAIAALGPGAEWAIAFDQDSIPQPGFVRALWQTATEAGNRVAAVGANWRDEARPNFAARHLRRQTIVPLFYERVEARQDLSRVTCVITSGTLFHLPTVRQLGGFAEGLFLDLVDTEFCLRARARGYEVRVATSARLQHRRGAKRPKKFGGLTFWPAFQPASRLQLLFRNRMWLVRRYAWSFPHWGLFELIYTTKILAEIIFLEDEKWAKLSACLRGTWQGWQQPALAGEKAFVSSSDK
jgi:rhamnosyltransferase